jgi:hypothetical protein
LTVFLQETEGEGEETEGEGEEMNRARPFFNIGYIVPAWISEGGK